MRKAIVSCIVLAGCAALPGLAKVPDVATLGRFSGEVVEVKDGDTIEVLRDGLEVEIRLAGVDAPEVGQAYAEIARDGLAHAILGKVVDVRVLGRDLDTCLLARIYLGEIDINLALVKAGLAWHYRSRALADKAFSEAQKVARKEKRGLWQRGPRPIPPWEYRRALEEAEELDLDREVDEPAYVQPGRPGGY